MLKSLSALTALTIGLTFTSNASAASLVGIDIDNGNLYSISNSDASLSLIGNTGISNIGSLESGPDGKLYGFTIGSSSQLYTFDPANGNASLVGRLNNGFIFEGGLAFSPSGIAYGTNQNTASSPNMFSIDLSTGQATNIGLISGGSHDINGLVWRNDGKLVGLDRETNSLLEIDPNTANSSLIANLLPTVGDLGGATGNGSTGFFNTAAISGSNELYSFDLFTGSNTLVGSFSPTITGGGISGIAQVKTTVPEPASTLSTLLIGVIAMGMALKKNS
ncbi:MAG: hypothetical protein F6K30_25905 [Cyanothece sp. SIO2G6]|nr:hypothetical protein [Cyanothece sp. SIO2G6]